MASTSTSSGSSVSTYEVGGISTKPYVDGEFPLPIDYFECPSLTIQQEEDLLSLGRKSWKIFRNYALKKNAMKWTTIGFDRGVLIEKGDSEQLNTRMAYYKGSIQIEESIYDAIDAQIMDTTESYRRDIKLMSEDVIDCLVLRTLIPRTNDRPSHYAAIKWVGLDPPTKLVKRRDLCFVEYCDEYVDEQGCLTWIKSMHSIHVPWCPSLYESHGLIRAATYYTGFVFRTLPNSTKIECIHAAQFNPKGFVPLWVLNAACKRRVASICFLSKRLQQKRFSKEHFLKAYEGNSKDKHELCQVCKRLFGKWKRKYNCRKCGKVICIKCHQEWKIEMIQSTYKKLRICTFCTIKSRENAQQNDTLLETIKNEDESSYHESSNDPFNSLYIDNICKHTASSVVYCRGSSINTLDSLKSIDSKEMNCFQSSKESENDEMIENNKIQRGIYIF